MTVALSSLRVTTDGDSSGYVRAAAQKVAADQQMIASDKARNASLAQADAALAKIPSGMASVSKALLDGYGAGAQFEAIVRRINNSMDQGMGLDRANVLLDAAYRKFGLTADASALAAKGFVSVKDAVLALNAEYEQLSLAAASAAEAVARSQTQSGINASFGIDAAPSKSAQESADAFLAPYGGLEGVMKAKAQEAGSAFAAELDARLIAGAGKSARDAASAFEAQFTIDTQKAQQAGENFQRSLTEALGGGGASATSQGATYSALTEELQRLDAIEQARAAHIANSTQASIAEAYGINAVGRSARESAAAFMEIDAAGAAMAAEFDEAIAAENRMTAAAEKLQAEINPLGAEFEKLGKQMVEYRALLDGGYISSVDFEQGQALLAKRLSDVDLNMRQAATGGRVLSGEMGNLGYQVNDVLTGLALGQPIFMIAAQQGGQIYQIFSHSKAGIADFAKEAGAGLLNFLTVGRLAFGGVAAAVIVAGAALSDYLASQNKVAISLSGSGRASGATVESINSAAHAGASTGGLSVSNARDLGAALAQTGKVANDNILPIIKLGKDFQTTFGVDDVEAAKMLADAFSDPAKGADQLNERLGFLDAGMKRQIESLVAQNKLYDAQKMLLTGVQGSLAATAEVTSFWSQMWTGLKNTSSDVFDMLGKKLSDYLHLNDTLIEQQAASQKRLASYGSGLGSIFGSSADYDAEKKHLADITALIDKRAASTNNAAAAQASLRQQATIMGQLPEVAQQQAASDQASVGGAVAEDPLAQRMLGISQSQADRVRAILKQLKDDYKTTFDTIVVNAKIANDAVTAFSPTAKADIAGRQAAEQYRTTGGLDPAEKSRIAQDAYNLSLKQTLTALSEAARVRELAANQSVASAQVDIDMVGKSIGQQAELRANLQARQTLEQEAAQNRIEFNDVEYARLKSINTVYAAKIQLVAQESAKSQNNFDQQTIALSEVEKSVADIQHQLHGDDWKSWMNDGLSAALRVVAALKEVKTQLPEIGQRRDLAEQASRASSVAADPAAQQLLGITQADADRNKRITAQIRDDFKTTFEAIQTSSKIALDSVTAFSPSAKALIAQRQAQEQYRAAGGIDPSEKAKIGQDAYTLSIKQTTTALSEAARQRALTSNQAVDTTKLEIDLLGKTIGQQAELRANLQSRQQLEQEASQNRTAFDNAQYERLKKINAEQGKQTDKAALATINDTIGFGRQTALLSPDDAAIAQQLKQSYPDVARGLASVEASGLRANMALSTFSSSASQTMVTGLADIFDGTKSVSQGFSDMSKAIIRALEEMLIKAYIVMPIFRMLQMLLGDLGGTGSLASVLTGGAISTVGATSLFGSASTGASAAQAASSTGFSLTGTGGFYDVGGYTGDGNKKALAGFVHKGEVVWNQDDVRRHGGVAAVESMRTMRGYERGGVVGNVVPFPTMGSMGGSAPVIGSFNVTNNANARIGQPQTKRNASGGIDIDLVVDHVEEELSGRVSRGDSLLNSSMTARYGVNPARGNAKR